MKHILAFAVMATLFAATASSVLAQTPALGTWKLNVAKSKYSPGPAPKSMTRTVESAGDKVKYTFEGVAADGSKIAYTFTVAFDGRDYPINGSGAPGGADAIAIKKTNSGAYEAILKKAGKPILISRVQVSKDSNSTTISQSSADGKGATDNQMVFDKQ
ncbi:MAG: hypothetical protein JWO71_4755 [Candidatus Acidoferrum typicum]|nr:hypothetical protein [Candidatus Acidoferrum typicum]